MLEKYHKLQSKHKTTYELKIALQTIWEELPREHINKAVAIFTKCLTAYMDVATNGGHSKHLQYLCPSLCLHPHLITKQTGSFQSHQQTILVKTTLGMLRNGGIVLVEIA